MAKTAFEMRSEETDLLILNNLQKQIPVSITQMRMTFNTQKQGSTAFAIFRDEPLVNPLHLVKYLNRQLRHLRIFTNQTRFDRVETGFSIPTVPFAKLSQLRTVLVEQTVKQYHTREIVVNTLDNQMRQVLVLVSEQTQNLLGWHAEARR
jgi:hypothetical protein